MSFKTIIVLCFFFHMSQSIQYGDWYKDYDDTVGGHIDATINGYTIENEGWHGDYIIDDTIGWYGDYIIDDTIGWYGDYIIDDTIGWYGDDIIIWHTDDQYFSPEATQIVYFPRNVCTIYVVSYMTYAL